MTEIAEKLRSELQTLPAYDRAALAHFLIQSLEDTTKTPWENAGLDAELSRRMEDIRSGREQGEPAEEVFAALRAKHSSLKASEICVSA